MGEDNESIVGSRKRRDVLVSVSAHVEQEDVRREVKPVRLPVGPQITLVDGPVVMKPGAWEERSVDRVVRVVVREDDVGDVVGPEASIGERAEDRPGSGNQPRVDDDDRVRIADQTNGRSHTMIGASEIPLEEHIDRCHFRKDTAQSGPTGNREVLAGAAGQG